MNRLFAFLIVMMMPQSVLAENEEYARLFDHGYMYTMSLYCDFGSIYTQHMENDFRANEKQRETLREGAYAAIAVIESTNNTTDICTEAYNQYRRLFHNEHERTP